MNQRTRFQSLFVVLFILLTCQLAHAQVPYQRVNGTVVGISGRFAGRSLPFSLIISRYTSLGEVTELNEARLRGEDELLSALSKMNAGRIQIGNSVGVPANAIIAVPWEGGTKITVLYERNINFFELRYGRRSTDYKFGYAELLLAGNGKGQGTLIPAARVNLKNGTQWEVEDFGVFPARLMGLRATGRVTPR
jgi:hypothetical protein